MNNRIVPTYWVTDLNDRQKFALAKLARIKNIKIDTPTNNLESIKTIELFIDVAKPVLSFNTDYLVFGTRTNFKNLMRYMGKINVKSSSL